MTAGSLAERVGRGLAPVRQLVTELTDAWGVVWRRSLQLRVVISTLALSAAVVVVLGLVLQTQIAMRVLQGKEADARLRTEAGAVLLERDLAGVDPDREGAQGELNNALDRLTNASAAEDQAATAGEFRAVLTTSIGDGGAEVSAGPVEDVPATLREAVAAGTLSSQYTTLTEQGLEVPTLIVGQPCAPRPGTWSSTCCSPSWRSNARSASCRAR
jgi:two-component system, OmpR family, sensor histidine kinase MtrB